MKVKDSLRRRLCGLWWSLKNGGSPNGSFSIPAGGLRPRHLAVVMPPDFSDFDVALKFLPTLLEHMNAAAVTVLVNECFRTWLSRDLGVRVVTFDPAQHDWLGLPRTSDRHKVRELGADVVVDLTPRFTPFAAALAASSSAPLRISLDPVHEYLFYNFFLTLAEDKSLAERYQLLLRYV